MHNKHNAPKTSIRSTKLQLNWKYTLSCYSEIFTMYVSFIFLKKSAIRLSEFLYYCPPIINTNLCGKIQKNHLNNIQGYVITAISFYFI